MKMLCEKFLRNDSSSVARYLRKTTAEKHCGALFYFQTAVSMTSFATCYFFHENVDLMDVDVQNNNCYKTCCAQSSDLE